jgi:hypothetical protein
MTARPETRQKAVEALQRTNRQLKPGTHLSMAYRAQGCEAFSLEAEREANNRRMWAILGAGQ